MYCKECGKEYETENASVCLGCGMKRGNGKTYCDECGVKKKSENQDICLSCGKDFKKIFNTTKVAGSGGSNKTKLITLLLWLFLGGIGGHCFYVGNHKRAWAYVVLFLLTCLVGFTAIITGILMIIDIIRLLTDKFEDGNGYAITQWN